MLNKVYQKEYQCICPFCGKEHKEIIGVNYGENPDVPRDGDKIIISCDECDERRYNSEFNRKEE